MQEFRWLLEELRVSFFAQELRTPQPVSVKRLDKAWAQRWVSELESAMRLHNVALYALLLASRYMPSSCTCPRLDAGGELIPSRRWMCRLYGHLV